MSQPQASVLRTLLSLLVLPFVLLTSALAQQSPATTHPTDDAAWEDSGAHSPERPEPASAAPGTHQWTLLVMPLVLHWEPSPDHRYAFGFALERRNKLDNFLVGFSPFRNSFGQPSAYAYVGKQWDNLWDNPRYSFKLTGGILYGYVDQWKDRVPFNQDGFAPAIIPILLYHLDKDQSFDVMVLGVGGLGVSYSHNF